MSRSKKDAKAVSLMMEKDLFEDLEEYCDRTYLSKTAAIEKAVRLMLRSENEREHDDRTV